MRRQKGTVDWEDLVYFDSAHKRSRADGETKLAGMQLQVDGESEEEETLFLN
jgi:hypothetical protein